MQNLIDETVGLLRQAGPDSMWGPYRDAILAEILRRLESGQGPVEVARVIERDILFWCEETVQEFSRRLEVVEVMRRPGGSPAIFVDSKEVKRDA